MRFQTDGRVVTAKFRPCDKHIGFKGVVHGGLTATVLDEIMVWACVVATQKFAFCAELNVRYLGPLAPDVEVFITSELVANRKGRVLEAKATIRDATGKSLAEATGKYMPIVNADTSLMMADFTSDARWLLEATQPN